MEEKSTVNFYKKILRFPEKQSKMYNNRKEIGKITLICYDSDSSSGVFDGKYLKLEPEKKLEKRMEG